jgi:hypothetical protein
MILSKPLLLLKILPKAIMFFSHPLVYLTARATISEVLSSYFRQADI